MIGQWTNIKPDLKEECILVTAKIWPRYTEYDIWEIKWIEGECGDYLGIFNNEGVEWGDIEELGADLWMILPKHESFS
jgi:hypothetical protein